jgi:protein required for attachment to host cells
MNKKLVIVAQKAGAKLFESSNSKTSPILLEMINNPSGRMKDQDIVQSELTQSNHTGCSRATTVSTDKSPSEVEADKFFKKLSDRIEILAQDNEFKSITLVAEPRTLGKIKEVLGAHASNKLTDTIQKDIAMLSDAEIKTHLAGLL